jgi:hypothetical protein
MLPFRRSGDKIAVISFASVEISEQVKVVTPKQASSAVRLWGKIYHNLAWITNDSLSSSGKNNRRSRIAFNIICIWRSLRKTYEPSGLKKLEKLVDFLSKSEELASAVKKIIRETNLAKRLAEQGLELGEDIESLIEGIEISKNTLYEEPAFQLLGIIQALEGLLSLQQGIEELIDNAKLVRCIEKLIKKVPEAEQSKNFGLKHYLEKLKQELFSSKLKRQTCSLVAKSAFSISGGATETTSGVLYFAGAASVATPLAFTSAGLGIAGGVLQTGSSTWNVYNSLETYWRIRKFKKSVDEAAPKEVTLLVDFMAEERFRVMRKLSANIANGLGGGGAIIIGATGIALLACTPLSLGATLPLGIAAITLSLAGVAAKYGTIYLLDKRHNKKLKLNPQLTRPALCLRLLQLLDKSVLNEEQVKTVEIFAAYYKKQLDKHSKIPPAEQLQNKLIVELAAFATKELPLFRLAWRAIIEEDHDILLENEDDGAESQPYEVLAMNDK